MGRIFLSHATEEHELVIHLANYLEKNNLKAWYAPRDIMGGIDYDKEIIAAIKDCRAFVLLLSKNSDASEDVKTEVYHAVKYHKQVICLDVDDVEPENLSYLLGMRHRLNWLERRDETLDKLIQDIKRIPVSASTETSKPTVRTPEMALKVPKPKPKIKHEPEHKPERGAGKLRKILYSGIVVVIVVLCVVFEMFLSRSNKSENNPAIAPAKILKPAGMLRIIIESRENGKLLLEAVRNNNIKDAMNILENSGHLVDKNIQDENGMTALIIAAKNNYPEIVRLLLKHGADTSILDNFGKSAYDYARNHKNFDVSLIEQLVPPTATPKFKFGGIA